MPIKLISIGPDQEACINILSEVTKKTKEECRVYADLVNSGNNLLLTISRPYSNKKAVELLANLGCTAVAVNSTNGTKNVDKHGIDNKETNNKKNNNKKTDNSETDSTKTSRKKTSRKKNRQFRI